MKVTLAFKHKENNSKFCWDCNLIKCWTKSKYYHVEMIIGNSWVSSRPDAGGVIVSPLQPLSDNWDYVEISVDGRKLKKVLKFIDEQKNTKYDWIGMFVNNFFNSNITIDEKNKWYCSEIIAEIMQIFEHKLFKDVTPSKTSPASLWNLLSKS